MVTSFGKRVLQARLSLSARLGRQVTQGDVAAQMGVTGVTVSRWEADAKEPALATITKLAKVLGVDASYLAFGVAAPAEPLAVDPMHARQLTDAEIARARAARDGEKAAKTAAAKKSAPRRKANGQG